MSLLLEVDLEPHEDRMSGLGSWRVISGQDFS
jgi:hypothetical protein